LLDLKIQIVPAFVCPGNEQIKREIPDKKPSKLYLKDRLLGRSSVFSTRSIYSKGKDYYNHPTD
jgi:hypothetical protein